MSSFLATWSTPRVNHTTPVSATLGLGGFQWRECPALDATIHPLHLLAPWMITLATLVILSMPTVILRSKSKEKGLRIFAGNLLRFLGLVVSCSFLSNHASVCYTFTLHASIRFLGRMELSPVLLGGPLWWGMRFLAAFLILLMQLLVGPPVSVVHWPGSTPRAPPTDSGEQCQSQYQQPLPCAYLCHLVGCVGPDLVLSFVRCLITSAQYIHIRED